MWDVSAVIVPVHRTLDNYVNQARRFRYIADADSPDPLVRFMNDEWDTAKEFEARGGGDCDGFSLWTIERAAAVIDDPSARFYAVMGLIRQSGRWVGHMWVGTEVGGESRWCDPTWHELTMSPEALGYPSTRLASHRWLYVGDGQFQQQETYLLDPQAPSVPAASAAPDAAFLSELVARRVHDPGAGDGWVLVAPLHYRSGLAGDLVVPAGARTDFCSVPRAPFAYLLAGGTGYEAGALHDHLYQTGHLPRLLADEVFAEALAVLGEPAWRITLMWQGVRLFGASRYRGLTP